MAATTAQTKNEINKSLDTLILKNLPNILTNEEKTDFLKKCGAVQVKILSSRIKKYNVAFAKFASPYQAEQALHQLHQQEIMGYYIVAEYARGNKKDMAPALDDNDNKAKQLKIKETSTESLLKLFFDKLNNWTVGTDFRIPIPSHLRYHYPPPNAATLKNISQQLATTPKFYTQVLHLMNKMNLPCPISNDVLEPVVPPPEIHQALPVLDKTLPLKTPEETNSESESEISSEEDKMKETIPDIKKPIKKKIKRPRIIKPVKCQPIPQAKKTKFSEIFEDPKNMIDVPKKLKLTKLNSPPKDTIEADAATGFGFILPLASAMETKLELETKVVSKPDTRSVMEEERLEKEVINCITLQALAADRISEKDRSLLPVFKNYAEGAPTCRLYVKNLAKKTTEEDLRFIFSRFLQDSTGECENTFDIRLMETGRMKGQAFVTLQKVELAKKALAETNGFILNEKPMVVQFARSSNEAKSNC